MLAWLLRLSYLSGVNKNKRVIYIMRVGSPTDLAEPMRSIRSLTF